MKLAVHPRNAKNPKSYPLHEAERIEKDSRFARGTNSEGQNVQHPLTAVAFALNRLAEAQEDSAPRIHEKAEVQMFWVGIEDGKPVLRRRGTYKGTKQVAVNKGREAGRFKSKGTALSGGELLDEAFLGRYQATDNEIWEAAVELVAAHPRLRDGETLKALNLALARFIAVRNGLILDASHLGAIGALVPGVEKADA